MGKIDLHMHSRKSDGSLTPTELVMASKQAGLEIIALTDHDTIEGIDEALHAGRIYGVEVIPGCELSVDSEYGVLHILGLWVNHKSLRLVRALDHSLIQRERRIQKIVCKLRSLGLNISFAEIQNKFQSELNRSHIAAVLMEKKIVNSINEAFKIFLGKHGQAYIPKKRMSPADAIGLLRSNGAIPVLAHPFLYSEDIDVLRADLTVLKKLGLQAIEAYYGCHNYEQETICIKLAEQTGLCLSGGSDFHGMAKPNINLGLGNMNFENFETLKKLKYG